jgi:2,5-diamino-6-(ribosylamino)-4(3H)-pyrimidinone 5'-phosphate reductase
MPERPRVLVNFASSIDGKITLAPQLRSRPFTMSPGTEDHRRMRELRAKADAVVIGASNLRADNPDLAVSPEERGCRRESGEREPYRIVLTRRGHDVTPDRKMFDPKLGGPSVVVHARTMPAAAREALAAVARLEEMGEDDVDVPRLLEWTVRELGVRTLLCEGGGVLCAEMFRARAVDELYLTLVPRILGGVDAPTLVEGPGFLPDEIPTAELGELDRVGDELFLRYDFRWA